MADQSAPLSKRPIWALAYAWSGVAIMWGSGLALSYSSHRHPKLLDHWPLPTVDHGGFVGSPWLAALVDLGLIALFGLQHSLMARPWFKQSVMHRLHPALARCTYVHMANLALFTLVIVWQPVPFAVWDVGRGLWRDAIWALFALGWIILFVGAWSFGIFELLGITQMRAWANGGHAYRPQLKTAWIYRWLRHPMYVGVLLGVWATQPMSVGHLLAAAGLTACAHRDAI